MGVVHGAIAGFPDQALKPLPCARQAGLGKTLGLAKKAGDLPVLVSFHIMQPNYGPVLVAKPL